MLVGSSIAGLILHHAGRDDDREAADDHGPIAAGADRPGGDRVLVDLPCEGPGEHRGLVVPEFPMAAPAERRELEREAEQRFDLSLGDGDATDLDAGPEIVR